MRINMSHLNMYIQGGQCLQVFRIFLWFLAFQVIPVVPKNMDRSQ